MLSYLNDQAFEVRKREPRRKVLIAARMRSDNGWADVVMRNVSSRGMLLECQDAPDKGTYIEVRKGDYAMVCRVMWAEGAHFGVFAQDRVNVEAIIETGAALPVPRVRQGETLERRQRVRFAEADIAVRVERNRLISSILQFGAIVAGGVMAATFLAAAAKQSLERPMAAIAKRL